MVIHSTMQYSYLQTLYMNPYWSIDITYSLFNHIMSNIQFLGYYYYNFIKDDHINFICTYATCCKENYVVILPSILIWFQILVSSIIINSLSNEVIDIILIIQHLYQYFQIPPFLHHLCCHWHIFTPHGTYLNSLELIKIGYVKF